MFLLLGKGKCTIQTLLFLFCKFLQVYGLKSINQGLLVAANDFPKIPNIFFQISVNSLNFKCALCWLSKHHYYPWGHVNYDCWGMLDSVWFSNKMMDTSEECLLKKRYHLKQRATSTFFFKILLPYLEKSQSFHSVINDTSPRRTSENSHRWVHVNIWNIFHRVYFLADD